jgi:Kef-type K+ transport system membrane component KefB
MHGVAFNWETGLVLGLLLLAALAAGRIAGSLHLPRVTAYLFVGILLGGPLMARLGSQGPVGAIVQGEVTSLHGDAQSHEPFEPLTKLAISLVLFNLGCQFPLARARKILRRVLRLATGEMTATFVLVFVGLMILGQSWQGALLLGALALATAPATTILVLKETEAEGPLTEYTNSLVAINNLAAIILFEMLFLGLGFLGGGLSANGGSTMHLLATELGSLVYDIAGSAMIGVAGGLLISLSFTMVPAGRRLVLLLAVLILGLAVCELAGMPYLLTFLAMGATVANSSDQTRSILAELDALTGVFCVVFFVAHGAELDLTKLGEAKLIGAGYIVFRFAGKYLGARYAAKKCHEKREIQNWLGATLTAQAGAAIALSSIAVARTEVAGGELYEICKEVQIVILGTVVVFEVVGPILIRQAVLRSGEMPLAQAIHHPTTGLLDQLRTVSNRVLIAFGRNPHKGRSADDLTIGDLMRQNPVSVPQTATFDELVDRIEHSRDNVYFVVAEGGELVGLVRYRELSSVLFDPALGSLVRVADVMTVASRLLHPEDSAAKAFDIFEHSKDDCLPIVTTEEPHRLVGTLRRRDVLRLLIRGQRDS